MFTFTEKLCKGFEAPANGRISHGVSSVAVNSIVGVQCDQGYVLHGYATWECTDALDWEPVGQLLNAKASNPAVFSRVNRSLVCVGKARTT